MESKLPTWEQLKEINEYDSFDGEGEKTELKSLKCLHTAAKIISGTELRCSCGAGWTGANIRDLANLLQNQRST